MGEFFAEVLKWFTNKDVKIGLRFWVVLLLLVCAAPFVANYFFGPEIQRHRLENFKTLVSIDVSQLSDPRLKSIYNDYVDEMKSEAESATGISPQSLRSQSFADLFLGENLVKFITGALPWALFFLVILFAKYDSERSRWIGVILVTIVGFGVGLLASLIPPIGSVVINYVAVPLAQIIAIAVLAVVYSQRKAKS